MKENKNSLEFAEKTVNQNKIKAKFLCKNINNLAKTIDRKPALM